MPTKVELALESTKQDQDQTQACIKLVQTQESIKQDQDQTQESIKQDQTQESTKQEAQFTKQEAHQELTKLEIQAIIKVELQESIQAELEDINQPLVIKAAPTNLTNQATLPIKVALTKLEQAASPVKQLQ